MANYYRSCIPHFAKTAEPLVALTRKNAHFKWDQEKQAAFDSLKAALASDQVMAHPKTDQEYLLYTDACDYAVGAILCQKDENGVKMHIFYLS